MKTPMVGLNYFEEGEGSKKKVRVGSSNELPENLEGSPAAGET